MFYGMSCIFMQEMYKKNAAAFILSEEDTVYEYEQRGKKRRAEDDSSYEKGMKALGSMDRIGQVEVLTGV